MSNGAFLRKEETRSGLSVAERNKGGNEGVGKKKTAVAVYLVVVLRGIEARDRIVPSRVIC